MMQWKTLFKFSVRIDPLTLLELVASGCDEKLLKFI